MPIIKADPGGRTLSHTGQKLPSSYSRWQSPQRPLADAE
jgi:hypothetical protein